MKGRCLRRYGLKDGTELKDNSLLCSEQALSESEKTQLLAVRKVLVRILEDWEVETDIAKQDYAQWDKLKNGV